MSKKVKVKSIQIAYPDGDSKELSIESAKALYAELGKLFEVKVVATPAPTPIIIERERWPRWYPPQEPLRPWVTDTPSAPQIWLSDGTSTK